MSVNNKFKLWLALTFAWYVCILGTFVYWSVMRASGFNGVVLTVQSLPLLLLLPGLLSRYYRVFSWLCFVMLLYFIVAVMGVSSSTASPSDVFFLLSTVFLFISSMMCSRFAQRVQKNISTP